MAEGAAALWAKGFQRRPDASFRVFFFPHAGAGAGAVQRWGAALPRDIEFRPIEYPGRWTRSNEPLRRSVDSLANEAAEALGPLLDRPFVVVGYSFGALVAFEWLRRLAQSSAPEPRAFLACALAAPHLPLRDQPINALPETALLRELARRYGAAAIEQLVDAEIRAIALPVLRADLTARESYVYRGCPASPTLTCPILALGGDADASVSRDDLDAWRAHTRGRFSARQFRGGHFFISNTQNADSMRTCLLQSLVEADDTGEGCPPEL